MGKEAGGWAHSIQVRRPQHTAAHLACARLRAQRGAAWRSVAQRAWRRCPALTSRRWSGTPVPAH